MERSNRVLISLNSLDISGEAIQDLTYDLCATLKYELDAEVEVPQHDGAGGTKGDPVNLGTIILTLIGGGGVVVSLVNVLKSYVEKSDRLVIKIKSKDGEVEVSGDSLRADQIQQTTELIKRVLKSK